MKEEANRLAKELSAYEVKKSLRILAQDVTPERTVTLAADNDGRIANFSAEGELFQIIAGRYSGGSPNMEVYLKGHAGDLMRVDRQNKESKPVFIERPALTIGLCVQPDVLRELPSVKGLQGRGLLARFLWVVPPSNIGRRKTKTDPVTRSRLLPTIPAESGACLNCRRTRTRTERQFHGQSRLILELQRHSMHFEAVEKSRAIPTKWAFTKNGVQNLFTPSHDPESCTAAGNRSYWGVALSRWRKKP